MGQFNVGMWSRAQVWPGGGALPFAVVAAFGALAGCSDDSRELERIGQSADPLVFVEQVKLTASDGADWDQFGGGVSISGVYAIVGARNDDDNGSDSGSAYVFERSGTGSWLEQAKLTASDGATEDDFGLGVSISGAYAIVGASQDDDNGTDSGSAYVFERSGTGGWMEQQKLTASDSAAGDRFGVFGSISDSYAIVSAVLDDNNNGPDAGSAYVFERSGTGGWLEQAKLTASNGAASDRFGNAVSISGSCAIVGTSQDDNNNGTDAGSAYVFERSGTGGWQEQAKLTASDGAAEDNFGTNVGIAGDYAIVGAYNQDANGVESGAAYVFVRSAGVWTEQQKLTASDGAAGDRFGCTVGISGSYAIVGAFFDGDNGAGSGSAYLFWGDGTGNWLEQAKLTASDGAADDYFGIVSISDSYAIVGAEMRWWLMEPVATTATHARKTTRAAQGRVLEKIRSHVRPRMSATASAHVTPSTAFAASHHSKMALLAL